MASILENVTGTVGLSVTTRDPGSVGITTNGYRLQYSGSYEYDPGPFIPSITYYVYQVEKIWPGNHEAAATESFELTGSSYSVTDQGSKVSYTGTNSFTVNILDVNERPFIVSNGSVSMSDRFGGTALQNLTVADPDFGEVLTVRVSPYLGSFTAGSLASAGFVLAADASGVYTRQGTASEINTAMHALFYQPVENRWNIATGGTETIGVTFFDEALSTSASVAVRVSNVNDSPFAANDSVAVTEDTPQVVARADFGDFSDPDPGDTLWLRIGPLSGGQLTVAGVPVSAGATVAATSVDAGQVVYTPAQDSTSDERLSFQVVDYAGYQSAVYTVTYNITPVNDAATGQLTITGTPTQGEALTATSTIEDADGLGTFAYQWQANGEDLAGATGASLLLAQPHVGKVITVAVSYTDAGGKLEGMASQPTPPVADANDPPTGSLTITGTPQQGQTLRAVNELSDADGMGTVVYQWQADGEDIPGATGASLLLGQFLVGRSMSVTASYVDRAGFHNSMTSAATQPVANVNDAPTGATYIFGTPRQYETLTAINTLTDQDGMGVISYQWQADGEDIADATGPTLALQQDQVGRAVSVVARYTDGFGTHESSSSSATLPVANVNDSPIGAVLVNGAAFEGQSLTGTDTLVDLDGLGALAYQWRANGAILAGATGSTLLLGPEHVGKAISLVVTYVDVLGTPESASSVQTEPVGGSFTASGRGAILAGAAGDDVLDAGTYRATLRGGAGDDTYKMNTAGVVIEEGAGEGIDLVLSSVSLVLPANVENVLLAGTGRSYATGNALANAIAGNSGDNVITGMAGADTLVGGLGADRFVYAAVQDSPWPAGGWDIIADFSSVQGDIIDLREIDANTARKGAQSFVFLGTSQFAVDATAQLRFDAAAQMLLGSIDADADPEFALELTGVSAIGQQNLAL